VLEVVKRALKTVFVKNFRNKVTALIFAVVIWGIVSFEVLEEYSRDDILLEVLPLRQGADIPNIRVEPERIILKAKFVCSRRVALQYLSSSSGVKAVHKLESPRIGEPLSVKIAREDFALPSDVRLVSVEPESVRVTLRQIVDKKLRVEVVTRGKPADGYELLSRPVIYPSEVTVKGPKEVIEPRSFIPTEDVVIEGRSVSFTSDYSIADKIDGTRIECQTRVRVTVPIGETKREIVLSIPVLVQTPANYKYTVTLVGAGEGNTYPLKLKGPKTVLEVPDISAKLTAFVVITPDLLPRPGVAYYRPLFLTPLPEAKDVELAQEKQIGVEIGEPPKPGQLEPKSP
jgi:hypothetical protein